MCYFVADNIAVMSCVNTRARSNNGRSSARAATSTTAGRGFVEFHPSMSLENAPTLTDCLAMPSIVNTNSLSLPVPDANDATLESVLADRFHVWTKVTEVIEKLGSLEAYQGDVHALQKLLQLHLLCNILSITWCILFHIAKFQSHVSFCRSEIQQRETHLRTLQLALLQEGRAVSCAEARTTETNNEDDKNITRQIEWQEEQSRYVDIVDSDPIDLIELSEQFS